MEDKRVTPEQILAEIGIDVERMAQKVADAINNAQAGAIIDQGEEQVRYADFHSLRHTTSNLLAASGVHPKVAQSVCKDFINLLTISFH